MLLLVSGASGVGKTTARLGAAPLLGAAVESAELCTLGPIPAVPTIAWRQRQVEVAVRRAVELEKTGRHLLFAGDPVPAGEALAAPSADRIDIAVCLLDAAAATQTERLRARQEPPELLPLHLGFAEWMRRHATDPSYVPEALTDDGWPEMCWERWSGRDDLTGIWAMHVIDTSALDAQDVARALADWCRAAIAGEAPVFRRGWHTRR
ncbi:hypothetical protein [Nocardia carnea]|uniref:hypothetical protein n=1 Tax=Nocardia carnea TaxID=37328 RepID=UPI002455683E|nr:hypothetical protein [Nocardia carnea]